MLTFWSRTGDRCCDKMTRRNFLRVGGLGIAGLTLADLLRLRAQTGAQPHKAVIMVYLGGGPSHIDMLDPKPLIQQFAGQRPDGVALRTERITGGLLPSPFAFSRGGQCGLEVSDLMPHLRERADDLCVLRGVYGSKIGRAHV